MAKVMTYAQAINYMLDNGVSVNGQEDATFAEACERLEALKAQLAKRNASTGERKPTKTQKDNVILREKIYNLLADEPEGLTPTEVASLVGEKVQKVTPQLTELVKVEKTVVKIVKGKRNLYFTVENAPLDEAEAKVAE